MAKAVWQGFILSPETGEPVSGAEVRVYDADSGAAATLYEDRDGTPLPGGWPATSDSEGFVRFYVDPSRIRVVADDGAQVAEFNDVLAGIVEEPYFSSISVAADTSATIDMLSALPEPGVYSLSCQGGTVSDDGAALRLRVSTDGSTVESGASDYSRYPISGNPASDDDETIITLGIGNDTGEEFSFSATITVDAEGRLFSQSDAVFTDTAGAADGISYASRYNGTGVTGVQIYPTSGTIVSGTFTLRRVA